ncbi:hypothetical protein ACWIUD_00330 [Helicobacter sp. 23-1044]
MGFSIFGIRFFDFTAKVTYADAFLTIALVCGISLILFLILRAKAQKITNND